MRIGFYSTFPDQMDNRMFCNPNVASGAGDDLLLPFVRLSQEAARQGIECSTADLDEGRAFDAFVFCEMPPEESPEMRKAKASGNPVFLIITENYFILKRNADAARYGDFSVVFTYDDSVVDGHHVRKLNYAFDLPRSIDRSISKKEKLAVMICSNHKRDLRNLLYGARRETINWFQDHHPADFDLYGLGWEKGTLAFQTRPELQRTLRRLGVLRFFPRKQYSAWKGTVERKRDVLGRYRFGFCYENTDKIPGYITEKIFDVMMAGTVPVYLGPENAATHIPEGCFIKRADFPDHESLYAHLSAMSDEVYTGYLNNINGFLSGPASTAFSITTFIHTLLAVFRAGEKEAS